MRKLNKLVTEIFHVPNFVHDLIITGENACFVISNIRWRNWRQKTTFKRIKTPLKRPAGVLIWLFLFHFFPNGERSKIGCFPENFIIAFLWLGKLSIRRGAARSRRSKRSPKKRRGPTCLTRYNIPNQLAPAPCL